MTSVPTYDPPSFVLEIFRTHFHLRGIPSFIHALNFKHIDIQRHFTWEFVRAGRAIVNYVSTNVVITDALTRSLPRP